MTQQSPPKPSKEQQQQMEQQAALQQQQQSTPFGQPMPAAPANGPDPTDPAIEKRLEELSKELDTWKGNNTGLEKELQAADSRAREAEASKRLHIEATKLEKDALKQNDDMVKARAAVGSTFSPLLSDKMERIESKLGKLKNMHGTLKVAGVQPPVPKPAQPATAVPKLKWGQQNAMGYNDPRSHPEWSKAEEYGWGNQLKGTPDTWGYPHIADNDPRASEMNKLRDTFREEQWRYNASPTSVQVGEGDRFRNSMMESTQDVDPGSMLGNAWFDHMYPGHEKDRKIQPIKSLRDVGTRAAYALPAIGAAGTDLVFGGAQSIFRNGARLWGNGAATLGNLGNDYRAQKSEAQMKGENFNLLDYKWNSPTPNQYQENWRAFGENAGQNIKDTGMGAAELAMWGRAKLALPAFAGTTGANVLAPGTFSEAGKFTENEPVNYEKLRSRLNIGNIPMPASSSMAAAGYRPPAHTAFNNPVVNDTYAPTTYLVRDAAGNQYYESRPNYSGHFDPSAAGYQATPAGDDTAYNTVSSLAGMMGLTRPNHQEVFGGHQLLPFGSAPPQFAPPQPGGLQQLLQMYGPAVVQQIMSSGDPQGTYDQLTQG